MGPALRPNVENVIRAHPDLVILYASNDNRAAAAQLTQAGIPTIALRIDHIAQFRAATHLLGQITGDSARAQTVVDTVDGSLQRLRGATAGLRRPTVFVPVWESPVMTVGKGSFITELLAIAGARNIYDSLPAPSATVALEDVVRRNPDYVLTTARDVAHIEHSARWRALPAVRAGRVLGYAEDQFERPSVRMGMAAWSVARLLHPGLREK
jgi:iron complex transport system substrate-binding protein